MGSWAENGVVGPPGGGKVFPITPLYKLDDSNLNPNSNLNPLKENYPND
jgi:hypothetical protein